MTKETNFMQPEFTLRQLGIQLLLFQNLQHNSQMLFMLFFRFRVNQNVINEYHYKPIQVSMKNTVHVLHEYSRRISDTEGHHRILVVSIPSPERGLLNVVFFYSNLVISRPQINLRKHTSTHQLIHQVINSGKWILVLYRHFIQLPIINTKPHTSIFLLYKQYGCSPRRYTWSYKLLLKQFF